jgi:hypothetical protein
MEHLEMVHSVLKHPEVFPTIADDQTPSADSYSIAPLLANPFAYFLMPAPGCLFLYQPHMTGIMFATHIAVVPSMRGHNAFAAGKESIRWMFENTVAQNLVGFIAHDNRSAIAFALRCGHRKAGRLTNAISVGGERKDMVITEINKAEWLRQKAESA